MYIERENLVICQKSFAIVFSKMHFTCAGELLGKHFLSEQNKIVSETQKIETWTISFRTGFQNGILRGQKNIFERE